MDREDHYLLGTQLGSCTLESVIGSGGMGIVFLAQQTRPLRKVAVKVLNAGYELPDAQRAEFQKRFRREADMIARLDHINILPIHEYGEQDGRAYLVMPHLTGGSLKDILKERGVIPPEQALHYIEQAGSALDYAHHRKIVHRDIKPANMLFHSDGRLVLVDFGIARIIHEDGATSLNTITSSDQIIGSVEYMAPEMVKGLPISPRTDIYELGVVLFQMLVGRVPFESTSIFQLAARHVSETPPFLFQLNPAISPEIDVVVQKALAKNPEDRYESASEMAQALRIALRQKNGDAKKTYPLDPAATMPEASTQSSTQLHGEALLATNIKPREALTDLMPGANTSPRKEVQAQEKTQINAPFPTMPVTQLSGPGEQATHYSEQMAGLEQREMLQTPMPAHKPQQAPATRLVPLVSAIIIIVVLIIGGGTYATVTHWPALEKFLHISSVTATPNTTGQQTPGPATRPTSITATPDEAEQAKAALTTFYQDINAKDYQDAYAFFGNTMQANQSYSSFKDGFTNTVNDDLTITSSALQNDDTYQINVVITSTEQQSDNTNVTHVYKGIYVVGQENGSDKILNASIQQIS